MIVVECYNDELLVKTIGFSKIKHEGGKGRVLERVKKNSGVIGIIDEDPDSIQPPEISEYTEKESKSTIKLLIIRYDKHKRIIQISPYLEDWILNRARQNRISPRDFNLPNDSKELHNIPHVERKRDFQKFLVKLVEIDDEVAILRKWLNSY